MSEPTVNLYRSGQAFPAAVREVPVSTTPKDFRDYAFNLEPVDSAELDEIVAYLEQRGLIVQSCNITQKVAEFTLATVTFACHAKPK